VASPVERESVSRERGAVKAVGPAATGQPLGRYSLYFLYWCKSANTDDGGGQLLSAADVRGQALLCVAPVWQLLSVRRR
jgi:hypothetical protein